MTAIAKSAKTHPVAKKCCGWEEPAIYWEVGTPHNIYRKNLAVGGWWVGGTVGEHIPPISFRDITP